MKRKLFAIIVLLFIFVPSARTQNVTGNLEGFVLDTEGIPIGGARIIVSSPSLQGVRDLVTDERGRFLFLLLPAGIYNVKITHPAYQEASFQNASIRIGRTTSLGELRLKPRVIEAHEVFVSAERPIIDPSSAAGGANVDAQTFEVLPIARDYRYIALLLPNATQSFLGDVGINFSGATGLENKYFIDGIEATNPSRGDTSISLPFNFVKELELRTGGYEAEYRSSLGGLVNVITYSGSNEFSGQAFGYFSNNRFSGTPRLGEAEPPTGDFSQYDFGLSIGGPFIRDKLWFFAAYDPSFQNEQATVPGLGFFPDKNVTHIFAGKLSWQASPKTSLVFTMIGDPSRRDAVGNFLVPRPLPQSLTNPDPYLTDAVRGGTSISLRTTHVFRNNFFIETTISRLSTTDNFLAATETGRNEPAFIDAENQVWAGGVPDNARFHGVEWTLIFKGTMKFANHILKGGIEYRDNNMNIDWRTNVLTRFAENFYRDMHVDIEGTFQNRIPSLFIQDSWQITRRLQANFGLRWDGQFLVASNGKVAQKILGQYQPRLGVVFEPGKLGTQRIFGSFGRFYQDLSLMAISNFFNEDYTWGFTDYDHDPRIDPSGGIPFEQTPGIQPENPIFRGQCYLEFTLGYERLLGRNFRIGARGIYRNLRQAIEDGFINLDQPNQKYYWGNPGRGLLSEFPRPTRNYTALELTLEKRGGKFNFYASYVLSRNYGNFPGLFTSGWGIAPTMTNQYDYPEMLVDGTGLLPNDRPHIFKFFGSYSWQSGLTLGTSIIWESGTPLSELGASRAGGEWNIFLTPRGTAGRTPSIFDLNFRAVYDLSRLMRSRWRPKIVLDIFHLTSRQEPVVYDQVRYFSVNPLPPHEQRDANPMYGQATNFFPPISVRLGFEVGF